MAVLDNEVSAINAGELFGTGDAIPIVKQLPQRSKSDALYLGIAPSGGKFPPEWKPVILSGIERGMDVVSGLHDFLDRDLDYVRAADAAGVQLIDVRKNDFGTIATGQPFRSGCVRVLAVGQDCSVGKMVATMEINQGLGKHTDAKFRVDANCEWTADQAIENSKSLSDLDVEFIEQPLPVATADSEKRKLFIESALPIVADEDCLVVSDVEKCHGLYHGVNVKISKCGGLSPSLSMLRRARELEMKTMVGCMVESSIGISGAAQLLPLLDFADLDGAILLRDEPASGIKIANGRIPRPDLPGCGTSIDLERIKLFEAASF